MIPDYPDSKPLDIAMRRELHPVLSSLKDGISEFTFANLYLFRDVHNYLISRLEDDILITGRDNGKGFFSLPKGMPEKSILDELFEKFSSMKCVSEKKADGLKKSGYAIAEDRDNFDYLYLRKEMDKLSGRKFHKKKNLVNAFISNYRYEGRPLIKEYLPHAFEILEKWRNERGSIGDYPCAKEALEEMEELQLCGAIYYVEDKPAAYTLGEELKEDTFCIHFEKGIGDYKGLMQFVSQAFASILPEKYIYINREQDLGIEGLRKAKESLRPVGFVKKYRVTR